jgi:NHLM bacteriocin system ABC transporter ATP-binding protein
MAAALAALADVPYHAGQAPLLVACLYVGDATGIPIRPLAHGEDTLAAIAAASGIRWRRVALRENWWQKDNGALVGTLQASQQPVALLPDMGQRYVLYNPTTHSTIPITAATAAELDAFAIQLYRPLPDAPVNLWAILRFGIDWRDVATLIIAGILAGSVQLALPLAARSLFDTLIPVGNRQRWLELGLALLMSAISLALLHWAQGIALIRLTTRLGATLQSALMDRVLGLPTTFFRQYSAGDLSLRVLSMTTIVKMLSDATLFTFFSTFFSFIMLGLMFAYAPQLAALAALLVLGATLITMLVGYQSVQYQRRISHQQGIRESTLFQIMHNVARLRAAAAEARVFQIWAQQFSQQRAVIAADARLRNRLAVFQALFPPLGLMLIYTAAAQNTTTPLSLGTLVGFSVAFTQLSQLGLGLGTAFIGILAVLPHYERARPLLTTPRVSIKAAPGTLSGAIDVQNVSFAYGADMPLVLRDIGFKVAPGEWVAVVGASGSGKSTLMRLLLGLEQPQTGSILYDGQGLTTLDVHQLRQQMGVVLQDQRLLGGQSIAAYLLEGGEKNLEMAWEALRLVGLADDVKHMPMQLQTLLAEGGVTLSGGQRQRLLLARALVKRPRLLFLDEATSAIDNQAQAIVMAHLAALPITRFIIAHRASTLQYADKIIVLEHGSIAQIGTYTQLAQQPGIFADLLQHQRL